MTQQHDVLEEFVTIKSRLDRLERLEEQFFFQEQTLSEVNDVVFEQQKTIDVLEARLAAVEEKFRELRELVGNEGGVTTVPPHYMQLS